MNLDKFVVYDVEVVHGPDQVLHGWDNPEAMGLASAVLYDFKDDQYHFYGPHSHGKRMLLKKLNGRIAVGFNSIQFDSRVILHNNRVVGHVEHTNYYKTSSFMGSFLNYDILLEVIKSKYLISTYEQAVEILNKPSTHGSDGLISLNGFANGTLGRSKNGSGAHATFLFNNNQIDTLLEYNLQDVRLTKQLFLFIIEKGFLLDKMGRRILVGLDYVSPCVNLNAVSKPVPVSQQQQELFNGVADEIETEGKK